MSEETRVCKECGKEKRLYEFKNKGRLVNGNICWSSECKTCQGYKKRKTLYMNCVYDPSGMYRGKLTMGHWKRSFKDGILPPGSVWEKYNGVKLSVYGNEHWHDILDCVRKPDESYLESVREKQRLVRI